MNMKKRKATGLAFEIDKLTRSIENVVTGDVFQTVVLPMTKDDLKSVAKKNGWLFNWKLEFKAKERKVFKLTTIENPNAIQGLACLEMKADHVAMQLVESAPHNPVKQGLRRCSGQLSGLHLQDLLRVWL